MTNREKLTKLITELITANEDKFFAIGGDSIRLTYHDNAIEVFFDNGDSDIIIECNNQILR